MLSFHSITFCSSPSATALRTSSSSLSFLPRNPRFHSRIFSILRESPDSAGESNSDQHQGLLAGRRINYAGVRLEETVQIKSEKVRLDSWISSRIAGISRARVQSSIRSGLVAVNGRIIDKVILNFTMFYVLS